jgi:hypothetical protein
VSLGDIRNADYLITNWFLFEVWSSSLTKLKRKLEANCLVKLDFGLLSFIKRGRGSTPS